jgi:hypothetical protein
MMKVVFLTFAIISVAFADPNGTCSPDEDPSTPTFLGDTADCSVYYTCVMGNALPSVCPEGLEWNVAGHYCDYPENANCNPDLPSSTTPSDVMKATKTTKSTTESETTTGSETTTTTTEKTTTTTDPNNKPFGSCPPFGSTEEEDTHLPDALDCTKFYKCDHGQAWVQYCPAGLEWSLENKACDWPQLAKCERPLTKRF